MVKLISKTELIFTHNLNFGKYKIEKICKKALAINALNKMNKNTYLDVSFSCACIKEAVPTQANNMSNATFKTSGLLNFHSKSIRVITEKIKTEK
jgi:hypothetical protein